MRQENQMRAGTINNCCYFLCVKREIEVHERFIYSSLFVPISLKSYINILQAHRVKGDVIFNMFEIAHLVYVVRHLESRIVLQL